MSDQIDVVSWFEERSVLVTGATGFLGKALVERLLRVCPPRNVVLMMRPKKGREIQERLEDFLNCQIFDHIRDTHPSRLLTVSAVRGDIFQENLGLSVQDRQMIIQSCHVVFHCAANVRFDLKLKEAVVTNTVGTKQALQLAKEIKNLDVFVYVSTAYCHCDREVLEEKCYPAPHDPNKIIDLVSWMDPALQDQITPKLLGDLPNTYAYSKALSEQLVAEHAQYFPVVLSRPSIVIASWKEPMPGWIENLNGPTGLLVGAGKGVIRSMHCKETYLADVMPVDICVNGLIALAWRAGTTKSTEPLVCNITESGRNPMSWGTAVELGRKHLYDNPFSMMLWYPDGSIKTSWLLHTLCVMFFHYLPAYFIDALLALLSKKPFLLQTQKRISGGLQVLQYYTTKEWQFENETFQQIPAWLGPAHSRLLFTSMQELDWDSYMRSYVQGVREYCCKEDPRTLPKARKLLKRMYYLDRITRLVFYLCIAWFIWSYSSTFMSWTESFFGTTTVIIRNPGVRSLPA